MSLMNEIRGQFEYQQQLTRRLGLRDGWRYRFGSWFKWFEGGVMCLRSPALLHPVEMRINTSDSYVFGQVLRRQEYAPAVDGPVRTIVDCGANVGYTSAYFLSRFPGVRVIAIEPFPANAEMCRRNLAPYGDRAQVIEAAVWPHPARLVMDYTDGEEWGVQVREARGDEKGDVDGIDLPSLGLERIDLLKIDIEGSELRLFNENPDRWLPNVSNIAIELHGPACVRSFETAMAGYAFESSESGELTICKGIKKLPATLEVRSV